MNLVCSFEGCTVSETGTCALEWDPNTCENIVGNKPLSDADTVQTHDPDSIISSNSLGGPVLERPSDGAAFPSSRTLGPDTISELMAKRYVTVVGILGDPESGKTACLASLYLLISNSKLSGWTFADSKSLMAFQEIAQGAREWNQGRPPEQMTTHTQMADDRRPGFLHLRLVRESDGRKVDFALPDLPGEWTTELVSKARADRFEFMKAADTLWIVIDGRALAERERVQGAISRLGQLARRLEKHFSGLIPRLVVIITHRDRSELDAKVHSRLSAELEKYDVEAEIIQVASFSKNADIKPGHGLAEVLDATVAPRASSKVWTSRSSPSNSRLYLSYRRTL